MSLRSLPSFACLLFRWLMIAFAFLVSLSIYSALQLRPAEQASRASAQNKNADTEEQGSPGWLVLRGEFVPGPYQVEIVADRVTVNGKDVNAVAESTTSLSSPKYGARERLFQQFQMTWADSVSRDLLSAARQEAVVFWRSSPLVASANLSPTSTSELVLLFRGDQTPEYVDLNPLDAAKPSPDEARDENLRAWASSLESALTHGRLVVVQNQGHLFVALAAEGEELLQELRDIVTTVSGREERFQAVRKVVPDDDMARDIAEHFR